MPVRFAVWAQKDPAVDIVPYSTLSHFLAYSSLQEEFADGRLLSRNQGDLTLKHLSGGTFGRQSLLVRGRETVCPGHRAPSCVTRPFISGYWEYHGQYLQDTRRSSQYRKSSCEPTSFTLENWGTSESKYLCCTNEK